MSRPGGPPTPDVNFLSDSGSDTGSDGGPQPSRVRTRHCRRVADPCRPGGPTTIFAGQHGVRDGGDGGDGGGSSVRADLGRMWNQRREWRRIARRDDWVAEPAEPPPLPPPLGSQGQVGGGPTATRAPAAAGPAGLVVYGHCRPLDARERLVQAVWRAARAEPVAAALPAVQSRACADLVRRNKDLVAMFSTMQMTRERERSQVVWDSGNRGLATPAATLHSVSFPSC